MNDKLPTLYEYSVCPFCHKVKALMLYKNIPFKQCEVNPMNKKEIAFSKDYRKVPILVDKEGVQVNDSTAIMRHLDKQYASKSLFEIEPKRIDEENAWLKWSDDVFVKALPPLIYNSISHSFKAFDYISHQGQFSRFQKFAVKFFGGFVMWRVAKKSAKKQNITDPAAHFKGVLNQLHEGMKGSPFLGREKPNGADLAFFGILRSIEQLPAFAHVKGNKGVFDWYNRVQSAIQGKNS